MVCFRENAREPMAKVPGFAEWYLDTVIRDTASYCGTELIRRTVGMANVKDVTTIADPDARAHAERLNILSGKDYIMNAESFRTGEDFVAAVLRADEKA